MEGGYIKVTNAKPKEMPSHTFNSNPHDFKPKCEPKLIVDGDVTIYINGLGNKTIVRRKDDESYDLEKAALYAILKSLGIKPSFVNRLVDNHTDTRAKRIQKQLKKERRKSLIQQQKERDEYEFSRLKDDMLLF